MFLLQLLDSADIDIIPLAFVFKTSLSRFVYMILFIIHVNQKKKKISSSFFLFGESN